MPASAGNRLPTRATHRKSRFGCNTCKRRRVKCDEAQPKCANCTRRSLNCTYNVQQMTQTLLDARQPRGGTPPESGASLPLQAFLENLASTGAVVSTSSTPASSTSAIVFQDDSAGSPCKQFDVLDLEILHHYSTEVSSMFAHEGRKISMWRDDVPSIAFSSSCVLHALLAFSALHLARDSTERRKELCKERAAYYYSITLPQMIASLLQVDDSSANALFVASSLLCFYNLARGPQPGQYLAFSEEGEAEWLWLQHGARAIHRGHPNALSKGWLGNDVPNTKVMAKQTSNGMLNPTFPPGFDLQINKLRSFASTLFAEDSAFEKYTVAIDELQRCYSDTWPIYDHPPSITRAVFAWFYRLGPGFTAALQEKRPFALIVYAHFTVIIHQARHAWYLENWGPHIMNGIHLHLHDDYRSWLVWPCQVIGWVPPERRA